MWKIIKIIIKHLKCVLVLFCMGGLISTFIFYKSWTVSDFNHHHYFYNIIIFNFWYTFIWIRELTHWPCICHNEFIHMHDICGIKHYYQMTLNMYLYLFWRWWYIFFKNPTKDLIYICILLWTVYLEEKYEIQPKIDFIIKKTIMIIILYFIYIYSFTKIVCMYYVFNFQKLNWVTYKPSGAGREVYICSIIYIFFIPQVTEIKILLTYLLIFQNKSIPY